MKPTNAVVEQILDRFESLMRHAAGSHAPEFLDVDVTMPQAKVLYLVSLRPGISMSTLAGELGIGPSAASGLVDRLVATAYLERREDPDDRRQQLVSVTDAGTAVLGHLRELNTHAMRRLIDGLDTAEREALLVSISALDREVQRLDQRPVAHADRPERTAP